MTPRALLTAIGATAIGFAVIITSLATPGAASDESVATTTASAPVARTLGAAPQPWNDDCVIAF